MFIGPDTVCFVMDPTRSGAVLARHAGIDEETGQLTADEDGGPRSLVISSDFYTVYESAGKKADGLVNLYCLAHVRRHFVRAGDANPVQLKYWTDAWLDRIRDLYAAHDELMAAWQEAAAPAPREEEAAAARLEKAHAAWDDAITVIDDARKKQMQAPGLQEPAKKALATLDREWDGLIAHRDYPMVSLDNNAGGTRRSAGPVVTRKNAGGSRNGDTARNAAVIWTVTATAADGRPECPDLPHRLPRRMRPQRRETPRRPGAGTVPALERQPRRPPRLGTAAPARIKPARITPSPAWPPQSRHAGHRHALSRDFRILTIITADTTKDC